MSPNIMLQAVLSCCTCLHSFLSPFLCIRVFINVIAECSFIPCSQNMHGIPMLRYASTPTLSGDHWRPLTIGHGKPSRVVPKPPNLVPSAETKFFLEIGKHRARARTLNEVLRPLVRLMFVTPRSMTCGCRGLKDWPFAPHVWLKARVLAQYIHTCVTYTYMHIYSIHISSPIHACIHGWVRGWMDECGEREGESGKERERERETERERDDPCCCSNFSFWEEGTSSCCTEIERPPSGTWRRGT